MRANPARNSANHVAATACNTEAAAGGTAGCSATWRTRNNNACAAAPMTTRCSHTSGTLVNAALSRPWTVPPPVADAQLVARGGRAVLNAHTARANPAP